MKIGIIVNGSLTCVNTPLAIRNLYGAAIQLEVIFDETSPKFVEFDRSGKTKNPWEQFLIQNLSSGATEVSRVANRLSYEIPCGSEDLHRLFGLMEEHKEDFAISEYKLSQPTLAAFEVLLNRLQQV